MKGKLTEIIDGWTHLINRDPRVEEVALKRAQVCAKCEDAGHVLGVLKCNECGCPLIAKTRSMDSKCPKGKWDE